MVAIALGLVLSGPAPVEGGPATPRVTVAFEIVVEDAKGDAVTDLRLEEVEVVQDAEKQKVGRFRAGPRPGVYEVSYSPLSGKPGSVTVRVVRPGVVVRGPDGPSLKPRVISALSPLEAELTAVLEGRPGASDLACDVAVLRFEPTAKGVRHSVAVEIPLSQLRFERMATGGRGRLQVLARVQADADPDVRQHVTLDQVVEVASDGAISVQRLVWTGTVVIGPGRHTIDVLVRDPGTGRATARTLAVEVPPPSDGLRMSSVTVLRPRGFFFLRDRAEGDDPLVYRGVPLMPTLQLTLAEGADTSVRFYVALYPAAGSPEPVVLGAELLREGTKVGEGPVALPKPEPGGEIRYVGEMRTAPFPAGAYVLRLVARQGTAVATAEAPFVLSPEGPAMRRLGPGGAVPKE
jgi:hypothetical protein